MARIAPKAVVVPARTTPDAEVVAVAARDRSRAQEFAGKHGIPRVDTDYAALLGDDEIDAVYNPLPNGLHGEWTIAALEAGKHVLCEKPFTANAIEAQVVADVAACAGKVVMEAFHYRYHPLFARVLELVGTLGALHDISVRMIAVLPNRRDVRYRLDLAGGATMDVGCYAIHQIRSVAGSVPERESGSVPERESGSVPERSSAGSEPVVVSALGEDADAGDRPRDARDALVLGRSLGEHGVRAARSAAHRSPTCGSPANRAGSWCTSRRAPSSRGSPRTPAPCLNGDQAAPPAASG